MGKSFEKENNTGVRTTRASILTRRAYEYELILDQPCVSAYPRTGYRVAVEKLHSLKLLQLGRLRVNEALQQRTVCRPRSGCQTRARGGVLLPFDRHTVSSNEQNHTGS
ncbi:hypothetical protein EYF80_039127 [Liparis tanakae]|uniref:Uncharacterized protein n=1 Tax=Liparis tanakae TaxID=230148 RepID=A0A4Z2GAQ2_9TELE|nr:hypothetical protein EYF80_039127 [Liparis tanakae]